MGFFGTYLYDGTRWKRRRHPLLPMRAGPWLWIDTHDSDFTTVRYRPRGSGTGVAYLCFTPRTYFDIDDDSEPTDVGREAAGLTEWWAAQRPAPDRDAREAKRSELARILADDAGDPPVDEDGDMEDAEVTTGRFLLAMDLPLPPDPEA